MVTGLEASLSQHYGAQPSKFGRNEINLKKTKKELIFLSYMGGKRDANGFVLCVASGNLTIAP